MICDLLIVHSMICRILSGRSKADAMFPSVYLAPAYNSSTGSRVLRRSCALFEQNEGTDMKYGDKVSITIREGHLHKSAAEQQLQQFSSEMPKKEAGMV